MVDRVRGALAVLDRLHGEVELAADAVPAGPHAGHRGGVVVVDHDAPIAQRQ